MAVAPIFRQDVKGQLLGNLLKRSSLVQAHNHAGISVSHLGIRMHSGIMKNHYDLLGDEWESQSRPWELKLPP